VDEWDVRSFEEHDEGRLDASGKKVEELVLTVKGSRSGKKGKSAQIHYDAAGGFQLVWPAASTASKSSKKSSKKSEEKKAETSAKTTWTRMSPRAFEGKYSSSKYPKCEFTITVDYPAPLEHDNRGSWGVKNGSYGFVGKYIAEELSAPVDHATRVRLSGSLPDAQAQAGTACGDYGAMDTEYTDEEFEGVPGKLYYGQEDSITADFTGIYPELDVEPLMAAGKTKAASRKATTLLNILSGKMALGGKSGKLQIEWSDENVWTKEETL